MNSEIIIGNTFKTVIRSPLSCIVLLGIVISIVFIILNLISKDKFGKYNKVFLRTNLFCFLVSIVDWPIRNSVAGVIFHEGKSSFGYYLDYVCQYVMNWSVIILAVCWLILYCFYKISVKEKVSNNNVGK